MTVSGGSGKGALKFSASGADCHIVATTGVLKATAATTCAVKVTKAASKGYRSATSPVVKFVFSLPKGSLAISNSVLKGEVGVPLTVTAKGGFGTGAVTFDTNGAVCSINPVSGALVAGAVGTCPVTATKAASGSYPAQTSAPVTFTFGPGPQSTLAISNSELVGQVGTNLTVVTSGGSGTGALSFSVTGTGCSIVAATGVLSDTQAGTCAVTAHKAASTSYLAATSAPVTFTFSTGVPQTEDPTFANPDTAVLTSIGGIVGSSLDNTAAGDTDFINQYYSATDKWLLNYVTEGSTVTLTWHVTGSYGQTLANQSVTLNANLQYGCEYGVTWSETSLNANPGCGGGTQGTLAGTTDANGNVTFTLTNTNTGLTQTAPSGTPTPGQAAASENNTGAASTTLYDWTRMALVVGGDTITANPNTTVNQASDLVDLIFIP